jgi:hypothetical protein
MPSSGPSTRIRIDGQGTDLLLEIVRDPSQDASVRQEALFWLAQSEDDRALDLISDILQK